MSHSPFIYHYENLHENFTLNCGRLTQDIFGRWKVARNLDTHGGARYEAARREAARREVAHALGSSDDESSRSDSPRSGDSAGDNSWATVAQLRWALASERVLNLERVTCILAELEARGELDYVRAAMRKLITALVIAHPNLAGADRSFLAQLVALGREIATAAANIPDIFEFVKKELQNVDLAVLLRV